MLHTFPLVNAAEAQDTITASKYTPNGKISSDTIPCYDPGNMQFLGHLPAMNAAQASATVNVFAEFSVQQLCTRTDMHVCVRVVIGEVDG